MKKLFYYADTEEKQDAGRVDCSSCFYGNLYPFHGEIFLCHYGKGRVTPIHNGICLYRHLP